MTKYLQLFILGLLFFGCRATHIDGEAAKYTSKNLVIQQVGDQVYQHTSYLQTESFGKVACNGMIVFHKKEAVIFNTTTNDSTSLELINWVENKLHGKVKAIIPTHFHADCLGGLNAFHEQGIPSYAHKVTLTLAQSHQTAVPQNGFSNVLELKIGNKKILAEYFGEGHTKDNIIGYFPDEKIVFGGCLIKETGAGKGNLEDANITEWPGTVAKLKQKYPDTKLVVPGHGTSGGTELFDYTINLFEPK